MPAHHISTEYRYNGDGSAKNGDALAPGLQIQYPQCNVQTLIKAAIEKLQFDNKGHPIDEYDEAAINYLSAAERVLGNKERDFNSQEGPT